MTTHDSIDSAQHSHRAERAFCAAASVDICDRSASAMASPAGAHPDGARLTSAGQPSAPATALSRMLAGRLTSFARLASGLRALALAAGLMAAAGTGAARAEAPVTFVSPEAALEQGLGAYRAGFYKMAQTALAFAAERKLLIGQYYLAMLLADSQSTLTDHARAYKIYLGIVEEHAASIDVDDDERAPYVGKALTALARYVYRGLPEIGLESSPSRAAEFLEEAATFFREPDGQFELAKLYLKGDGVPEDRRKALHWLSTLTQEGHVGAQAFLADLLWHGKVVPRDETRALALIRVAAENSPPHERIWIEDILQRIYCGVAAGVRQQADGLVASYRHLYGPRGPAGDIASVRPTDTTPTRTCGNGEALPPLRRESRLKSLPGPSPDGMRNIGMPDAQGNATGQPR